MVLVFTNTQLSEMANTSLRDKLLEIQGVTLEQLNSEASTNQSGRSCLMFSHRIFTVLEGDKDYYYDAEWLASTKKASVCLGCAIESCTKSFIKNHLEMEVTEDLVREVKSYAAFISGFYPDYALSSKIPGETVRFTCTICGETSNWNGQVPWTDYKKQVGWESEKRPISVFKGLN